LLSVDIIIEIWIFNIDRVHAKKKVKSLALTPIFVRGKFFNKEATFEIPVYLEPQNEVFVRKIAEERKMTLSEIVNQLISKNKELVSIVGSH